MGGELSTGLRLAQELVKAGDHHGAAIEFRRLALAGEAPEARGGFFWAAGYEYWQAGQTETAGKMLDRAEDEAPALGPAAYVLRGEVAQQSRNYGEAAFYFESILRNVTTNDPVRRLAALRLAALRTRERSPDAAQGILEEMGAGEAEREAVRSYAAGRDKSPKIGGALGLIPGLGYAYAGEYASGLRSLILNALFIWGMAETADDEDWGVFAVLTFFEFTWYSGSIYGGIDASHRHNRDRLEECLDGVNGESRFELDYTQLPTIALRFEF